MVTCRTGGESGSMGSATPGSDYTQVTRELTFPLTYVNEQLGMTIPGDKEKICRIPILDDALDEDDELIPVDLTNATGGARIDTDTANLEIVDNEDAPSVSLSPTEVDEDGGMVTFTATLSEASGREANTD